MPGQSAYLKAPVRLAVALLCVGLAGSFLMRGYVYSERRQTHSVEAKSSVVDRVNLGQGVTLPLVDAVRRTVGVQFCSMPAAIDFISASPYGSDPSLTGAPGPGDRVAYFYHGWNLGSRVSAVGLNAIYFARRAYAVMRMADDFATDDLAVKVIVPASCYASPEDVMTALRRELVQ